MRAPLHTQTHTRIYIYMADMVLYDMTDNRYALYEYHQASPD